MKVSSVFYPVEGTVIELIALYSIYSKKKKLSLILERNVASFDVILSPF
jgi:hypothetical protein